MIGRQQQPAPRGMTLIEILVAVALLSMMGALAFGVLRTMFAISDDADEIIYVNHTARISMERMTRDLSHAYLSLHQNEEESTKTVFEGERDKVTFAFLGNVPVRAGRLETDEGIVEYKLEGNSEGRSGSNLIRRFKPVIDDRPDDGGDEFILGEGVKTLTFEYFDGFEHTWRDSWDADDWLTTTPPGYRLPHRIKIHLELYDRDDHVYVFETQTTVYITEPLLFGQPKTPKQLQWRQADKQLRAEQDRALRETEE